jgi:hypothetical protein
MMKNLTKFLLIGLFVPYVMSCAPRGITVGTDAREDSNMNEFKTYSWLTSYDDESGTDRNSQNTNMNRQGMSDQQDMNQDMGNTDDRTTTMTDQNQYNQMDERSGMEDGMLFNNKKHKKSIKEAIETQLEARGFTEDTNNPDVLITVRVTEREEQLRTFNRRSGTGMGQSYLGHGPMGANAQMVEVEPGTILLNFMDAESGDIIWQGFASGALEEGDMRDEDTIKTKIGAIFDQFNFSNFSNVNVAR